MPSSTRGSAEPITLLGLADGAVATSTTLRRRWQRDGQIRHHLIDPQTGLPSDTDLTLATVVAAEAWVAEVLAKAVLLAGSAHPFDILGGTGAEALVVGDRRSHRHHIRSGRVPRHRRGAGVAHAMGGHDRGSRRPARPADPIDPRSSAARATPPARPPRPARPAQPAWSATGRQRRESSLGPARAGRPAGRRPPLLYLWGLGASGWANSFYSAAVQAGAKSWKAFFFGSSDAANFITVDKPPAALWVMEISARLFGVNAWSILVPQALEGVAAVGVLYAAVRRWFGAGAALLAGVGAGPDSGRGLDVPVQRS